MNKQWAIWSGVALLVVGGIIAVFTWGNSPTIKDDITENRLTTDLQTKWVVIGPQGQLWGFAQDQRINAKVLEVRELYESKERVGKQIYVRLNVMANIPAAQPEPHLKDQKAVSTTSGTPKTDVATQSSPVAVELFGIAKMNYELISGTYYLSGVDSVNLAVRPVRPN